MQYLLGLRRLGRRAVWLEIMESSGDPDLDARKAGLFRRRLRDFGLEHDFCLMVLPVTDREQDPAQAQVYGIPWKKIRDLLGGPNVLLDLSYSTKPPLTQLFEQRKLCSLDPTEVCFWMRTLEMGQSTHQEFWSIGLNLYGPDSLVPPSPVTWKTFFPLVDTSTLQALPRPVRPRFSTIGQWYWDGMIQWEGEWKDFSKKAAFEKFMNLPSQVRGGEFELAMNLNPDDPERDRIRQHGWRHVDPHEISRTPKKYYAYLARSLAEFSAVKLESHARSGWLSDRSAAYLALGRPVVTESTGAEPYLPAESGMLFVDSLESAAEASRRVLSDWPQLSRQARDCAVECFDAAQTLRRMLD